jgi:hypothetical protein
MWLLSNLNAAESAILIVAWLVLFVGVPAACVVAAKAQSAR